MDLFLDRAAPRAQFREQDISPYFWPKGLVPISHEWTWLRESGCRAYHLRVTGLVERPLDLTLADLILGGRSRPQCTTVSRAGQGGYNEDHEFTAIGTRSERSRTTPDRHARVPEQVLHRGNAKCFPS